MIIILIKRYGKGKQGMENQKERHKDLLILIAKKKICGIVVLYMYTPLLYITALMF